MEKTKRYVGRRKKKRRVLVPVMLLMLFAIVAIAEHVIEDRSRFKEDTYIDGVNCSELNVDNAKIVIESKEILFLFADGTKYFVPQDEVGRTLTDTSELKDFLSMQYSEEGKEPNVFSISPEGYEVNEDLIEEYLKTFSQFNEENMSPSTNAYMRETAIGLFEVVPEVYGNEIELSEAISYTKSILEEGEYRVDFGLISSPEDQPKILVEDLKPIVDKINMLLNTEIELTLFDGSSHILNRDIIKDWIYQKEAEGIYDIDIEEGVKAFVYNLNQEVEAINTMAKFKTNEGIIVTLPVKQEHRVTIDTEKEIAQITLELEQGGTHSRDAHYLGRYTYEKLGTYAEFNITQQYAWAYKDGICVYEAPFISGQEGVFDTPIGIFYSNFKALDYHLSLYGETDVAAWITVDGDIGIHAASELRDDSEYTPDRYKEKNGGSHGCFNMKDIDAIWFYDFIVIPTEEVEGTPIIVHY